MAVIDIRLDGTSISDDVLYQQTSFGALANGQPGQASVVIKNDKGQYAPTDFVMGMTLELYVDGQREWDGWLFDFKRTWPFEVMDTSSPLQVPKYWKLRGFDRNLLFQKRIIYKQSDPDDERGLPEYAASVTDQAALLDYIANYVDLSGDGLTTTGIKEVTSPGQGGVFTLAHVGAPLGLAFDDCAKMSGAVFYIDPDRVINYRGDTDVNAPFDLSDKPWAYGNAKGYANLLWSKDFTDAATDAMVWGAGYGSPFPVFARHEGDIATYGRWQWGDIFVGAYKQATVNKRARTYVEGSPSHHRGHGTPLPSVTLTMYEPGLRCGMVTNIENAVHGLSRALPVMKLDIAFPTPSSVRYDMELGLKIDAPFSAPDLWALQDWTQDRDPTPNLVPPAESSTQAYLIDHYDTPIPTSTASTYDSIVNEFVYGSLGAFYTDPDDGNLYFRVEWPLPSAVEKGDLVLLTGAAWMDTGNPAGVGLEPKEVWECSEGWYFGTNYDPALPGYHTVILGYGKIRGDASTDSVYAIFHVPYDGDYACLAAGAVITVIKGKANNTLLAATATTPFNPENTYGGFIGDATAAIGVGFCYNTTTYPSNMTALSTHGLYNGNGEVVTAKAYLGDSYVADHIEWATGAAPGLPGPWAAAQEWWLIHDEFKWLTPGPSVTGHSKWPGGNEYYIDGNEAILDVAVGSEVRADRAASSPLYVNWGVYSDYMGYIDDPDGTRGSAISQGEYVNDPYYPDAPFQGPMDWLIKLRFDDLASTSGYVTLEHYFLDFDHDGPTSELDAAGTELYRVAWIGEIYVDVVFRETDIRLDVYNAYNEGTGILPSALPDTFVEDDVLTIYAPWEHNWWFSPLTTDVASGDEYYLRVNETGWHNRELGARKLQVKLWKVGDLEPSEWLVDGVLPMYKAAAYKHLGHDSVAGSLSAGDYSASFSPFFRIWEYASSLGGDDAGVDAIWALIASPSVSGEVAEVPRFISAEADRSNYQTQYPYVAGSLVVYVGGVSQGVGDFVETDPSTGAFSLFDPSNRSADMYVTYTRSSAEQNYASSGVYRPAPVTQYGWGSALDGFNCSMASGCVALDRHTLGANSSTSGLPLATPPTMRSYQFDQSGGADLGDLATAWSNGWGQTLQHGIFSWATFLAYIRGNRGAVLQGLYSELPASKRFSDTFTGGHSIFINEELTPGYFLGFDPLTSSSVVYTEAELKAYAEGLSWVGANQVSAGFTRITD